MNTTFISNAEEKIVSIDLDSIRLQAEIVLPQDTQGIVIFVHNSGIGRYSTRNRYLAHMLRQTARLATVQIDLLTPQEEAIDLRSRHCGSNVKLLSTRLIGATNWLLSNPLTSHLKIGYFGEQTGASAAFEAVAENKNLVGAVVSCSGEACLTPSVLSNVETPTLLIVGEDDLPSVATNEDAFKLIEASDKELKIIQNASRQFKEPGAFEEVARLAAHWFDKHLSINNYQFTINN
jgi:dienelactone hydrolase